MPLPPGSKREHLRRLVEAKSQWSRLLTDAEKALGFLGWHERGFLPHCDFPDLVQFITFRLADSMPASRCGEWEHLLKIENVRERRAQLEAYLDRGAGECLLREARIAQIVEGALLSFHQKRYELLAWCVMPNHVHVLVNVKRTPLWKMIQSWKRFTATEMERRSPTRRDDSFKSAPARRAALQWQREYWDTFMRDETQERKAIQYVENNPVKAKLCRAAKEWPFSSARFQDDYGRLVISGGTPVSDPA